MIKVNNTSKDIQHHELWYDELQMIQLHIWGTRTQNA